MTRLEERIRIGIVGLGWVGQEVARAAIEDPRVILVGVVDADSNKAGRDLGEIIGEGRLGIPIDSEVEAMLGRARPEVAVVCTTSDVEELGPTLEACVAHGANVVTTCENLADADVALSQLDEDFDGRVRQAGLVVLATGVNPGFAMDRLPVMLAQATRKVVRLRVGRVVDASTRRAQLQAKIGVGMSPARFNEAIKRGEIGHAGLSGSLRLIAKGLGLQLEKTAEVFSPVLADEPTTSVLGPVSTGKVRGIYQIARGYRHGREVITLELTMALDESEPRDTIDIVGEPPIHYEGELPGDACTVACVLSAISVVVTMQPGLRTVLDVPLEQPEEPLVREPTVTRSHTTAIPTKRPVDDSLLSDRTATVEAPKPDVAAQGAPSDSKASASKKAPSKKAAAEKAPAKKTAAKKTSSKKAPAKKSAAKKASTKKAPAKKTAAKKAATKKAPSKKTPAKKAPAKKTSAKKAATKKPARKKAAAKKTVAKKTVAKKVTKKPAKAPATPAKSGKSPAQAAKALKAAMSKRTGAKKKA